MATNNAINTPYVQIEVDFGSTPVSENTFTITDARVSVTSLVNPWLAGNAPTGKDQDELEMDELFMWAFPASGSFSLYIRGMEGYISDKYKINYQVL